MCSCLIDPFACPILIMVVLTLYLVLHCIFKFNCLTRPFSPSRHLSLASMSFPLCVTSSHFISIPLSPALPNQVLGRGGGIMCAGVLICHMGPWSCNQNSFWANLCAPFEHAQSYTHRLPGFSGHPLPHSTPKHNQ